MPVKTRFAPSPTGFLHVGGLRTALFEYLFAKKHQGKFLIRIEDTDQERFVKGGVENILNSLAWTGIAPDEGVWLGSNGAVVEKGAIGPYVQSKRIDIYYSYIEQLIGLGHAYRCFCDKMRLEELRSLQEANKQAPGYDGRCRNLDPAIVNQQLAASTPHVVRMKMPKEGTTKFTDLVRGKIEFENKLLDDHILLKSDGFPTYHFAVVIDDHLMKITHVIRGEEWLPSTPKHILLYQMFKWKIPEFAHLSLLVNEQKQKLSKRHGDVSVEDFKAQGYLPEALVNFIAFLGWNPGDEREIFSLQELEQEFDFTKVSKAAAVFNRVKLDWYNQQYIRKLPIGELTKRCLPYLSPSARKLDLKWLEEAMGLIKERLVKFSDVPGMLEFLLVDELDYEPELLIWRKSTREKTKDSLLQLEKFLQIVDIQDWNQKNLEYKVGEWIAKNGFGTGDVLWPMRVALSGQKNSPGPYEISTVLGKKKTLERIVRANFLISTN